MKDVPGPEHPVGGNHSYDGPCTPSLATVFWKQVFHEWRRRPLEIGVHQIRTQLMGAMAVRLRPVPPSGTDRQVAARFPKLARFA